MRIDFQVVNTRTLREDTGSRCPTPACDSFLGRQESLRRQGRRGAYGSSRGEKRVFTGQFINIYFMVTEDLKISIRIKYETYTSKKL